VAIKKILRPFDHALERVHGLEFGGRVRLGVDAHEGVEFVFCGGEDAVDVHGGLTTQKRLLDQNPITL
jgi:hypothetical protein